MPTVKDVLLALEEIAPKHYALSFDKVGLQVGDPHREVTKAVVSLDRSLAAVDYAIQSEAQLLLSHHPLIFEPLATVTTQTHVGRTIQKLLKHDIAFVAAHTNWDAAPGGINDTLAAKLGLNDPRPFGMSAKVDQLKLVVFVPEENAQDVIDAASEAGAGVIGLYKRCAYLSNGIGTFLGTEGTNPTIGEVGKVEEVAETRIEMILPESRSDAVRKTIAQAHPYEEPAYDLIRLLATDAHALGRVGTVGPRTFEDFVSFIDRALATRSTAWGDPAKRIKKVAVVGGAADTEWIQAQREGADVLVTGEVKQHVALEAGESGMCIVAAGHYATEHPGCVALAEKMSEKVADVEWVVFEPAAGSAGRPL